MNKGKDDINLNERGSNASPLQLRRHGILRNTHAFTFIEAIAILLIFGVISVVIVSNGSKSNANLIGQSETLKSHMRYAQSLSMSSDVNVWGIHFNTDSNAYWLFYCPEGTACNVNTNRIPIPGAAVDGHNRVLLDDQGIHISSISVVGNQVAIAFDRLGRPYWGDANQVLQNRMVTPVSIVLAESGNTATISITPETGFVR